jgi:glucose-6-phosphate-specific signal transduction histidine kinase
MGIRGMRERATRIGAQLSIGPVASPATGTSVVVDLDGSAWGRKAGEPVAPGDTLRESVAP